jgi:hypothetical protein
MNVFILIVNTRTDSSEIRHERSLYNISLSLLVLVILLDYKAYFT